MVNSAVVAMRIIKIMSPNGFNRAAGILVVIDFKLIQE
jgi:hypothetical protein